MKKLLLTSTIFLAIFFISTSFTSIPENYFKIGNDTWDLESAELANESYSEKSKFELDFINGPNDFSDAQTFIYLSLTSSTTYNLADGIYKISSKSPSEREPFNASGSVFINEKEIKIDEGSFSVENLNDSISVHMIFELSNGDILNGSYNGKFSTVDRSTNYK